VVGPSPDPFPAPVHVRPAAATTPPAPVIVVTRHVVIPRLTTRIAPRAKHHARPHRRAVARRAPAAHPMRIPDHAAPTAIGALAAADPRRRVPLALVLALGGLTLASGALVGRIAWTARA
jgi:hypothetical protein